MDGILQSAREHYTKSDTEFLTPRIVVAGVGGGGCNTINRLVRSGVRGAELMAFNTDKKHLSIVSEVTKRVLLGASITRGLGAGGFPEVAQRAAEASRGDIEKLMEGCDLLFLAAGMGGGTGTGAAPVIAEIAKKQGAIVVAMVTYPFVIERARLKRAQEGLDKLKRTCDTIVVIDNNRLVEFVPNLPMEQAFNVADEITARAVRGITETITTPSLINLDFADVRAVMSGGGISMIAVGEAKGINRVKDTVKNTLKNRLLDVEVEGATGVLLHLTGGPDMTLGEANEAGELLTESCDRTANVIWGARLDGAYEGKMEAIAIFTGLKGKYSLGERKAEKAAGFETL